MSSDSDSEEFYDAEDIPPNHGTRYKSTTSIIIKYRNSFLTPINRFVNI